jgi:hypothetical protein
VTADRGINHRKATVVATSALLAFGVLAIIGILQLRWSREVVFSTSVPTDADWTQGGAVAKRGLHGRRENEIAMPGVSLDDAAPLLPSLVVGLPRAVLGYRVNVSVRLIDPLRAPLIVADLADKPLVSFSPHYWPAKTHGRDCHEFSIPGKSLTKPLTALRISNRGGHWMGRILLIPYGCLRPLVLYGLPLLCFIALCGTVLVPESSRLVRWRPVLVAGCFFLLYACTLFSKKVAPTEGFFWDDALDYIHSTLNPGLSFKAAKHLLLFPVMGPLYRLIHLMCIRELHALVAAYALIGALNVTLAHFVFRRVLRSGRDAVFMTLLYGFSFATWVYSSLFESYIFTALLTNAFIWVFLAGIRLPWVLSRLAEAALIALAALAHPPMLILTGACVARELAARDCWTGRLKRIGATVMLVLAGYAALRLSVQSAYPPPENINWERESNVSGMTAFAVETVQRYARAENLSLKNAGNVVIGQFAHAFGGFPQGHEWNLGWAGGVRYFRSVSGSLFALGWIVLWGLAFCALRSEPKRFKVFSLAVGVLVLLPYLGFYWYLNPTEMLLYSAPLTGAILVWLSRACQGAKAAALTPVLAVLAVLTIVRNTLVIASYR